MSDPGRERTVPRFTQQQLAVIRHELRTPINHIIGYSEMIMDELDDVRHSALKADLEKVRRGGRQLQHLINQFFDSEKQPVRELEVSQIYHELRTPVNQIIGYSELLQEEAAEAGLTGLLSDLDRIHQAATQWLRLMERYLLTNESESVDASQHSTGLDPRLRTSETGTLSGSETKLARTFTGSILVVDDDPVNRDMLARRLHKQGFTVTIAKNGAQALELLQQKAFDLLLLDILMPGLSGYEVLRQIKESSQLQHIPVLMISALDDMDGIVRCIQSGAEDYISKPFNPVFLNARISAVLEKKRLRDQQQIYLKQIEEEKANAERLLLNILPAPIAARLKNGEQNIAEQFSDVSVLFADLVGFTMLSSSVAPHEMVRALNGMFSSFDSLAGKHGLEKIKTIGDAYMAVAGLPEPASDHAEAAAEMALDILDAIRIMNRVQRGNVKIRIGISSGPVVAGIIGTRKFSYDLWGDTVNVASRMESQGEPDKIQVSESTYRKLKSKYRLEDRGVIPIKGKGTMQTYWLLGRE